MDEDETSFFLKALGRSPMVKVIDYLLENPIFDFTKSEISDGSGVSRVTLEKIWTNLEETGMLIETRRIGNGILYKLNRDSPVTKKMLELEKILNKIGTEKLLEGEMEKAALVPV